MKINERSMEIVFSGSSGVFEVIDYIEFDKPVRIFRESGFVASMLTNFPEGIFEDGGLNFKIDFRGTSLTMEVWDINSFKKYIDKLGTYTYKGLDLRVILGKVQTHYDELVWLWKTY